MVRTPNVLYNAKVKRTDSDQTLGEVEGVVAGISCPVGLAKRDSEEPLRSHAATL